jgi:hypothetical protein
MDWQDLLTGEQVCKWVMSGERVELPKLPGVYRWLLPGIDGGNGCAYVGEGIDLQERVVRYLNEARKIAKGERSPFRASDYESTQEQSRNSVKENHKKCVVRVAAQIAIKCKSHECKLQCRLVDEEMAFFGVELNNDLTSHKAGRIFLEAHALMETKAQRYRMLNRNFPESEQARNLKDKIPHLRKKTH